MSDASQEARSLWNNARRLLSANPNLTPRSLSFIQDVEPDVVFDSRIVLTVSSDSIRVSIENDLNQPLLAALEQAAQHPMGYLISVRAKQRSSSAARFARAAQQQVLDMPPAQITVPAPQKHHTGPYASSLSDKEYGQPSFDGGVQQKRQDSTHRSRSNSTRSRANTHPRDAETHLNTEDRFENFVAGPATKMANAAAQAVSEQPGEVYNPLFIYGGSGLGKTHLLNAIGNEVRLTDPEKRIYYTTAEEFTNEFINALQTSRGQEFNSKYRSYDVLLIDDIQFLGMGNRVETQEAFFNTFNSLYRDNKQIVITSDVAPRQLNGLEKRMITRFEQGLTVDVQPPEKETRIAILRMKIETSRFKVTISPEVIDLIADQVTDNIRELEGALTRIVAMASLNKQPVTVQLAQQTLQDYFVQNIEVTPQDIIALTARYFQLDFASIVSTKRQKKIAMARQIAMYICREMTGLSLSSIGEVFGGKDHTTVIHACKKVSSEMAEKREVYNYVTELTSKLKKKH